MPPADPRLCPGLERALPAGSDRDSPGYRRVMQLREIRFGDGAWHPAMVRAEWRDRSGRRVVQLEWHDPGGDTFRGAYLHEPGKVREV